MKNKELYILKNRLSFDLESSIDETEKKVLRRVLDEIEIIKQEAENVDSES